MYSISMMPSTIHETHGIAEQPPKGNNVSFYFYWSISSHPKTTDRYDWQCLCCFCLSMWCLDWPISSPAVSFGSSSEHGFSNSFSCPKRLSDSQDQSHQNLSQGHVAHLVEFVWIWTPKRQKKNTRQISFIKFVCCDSSVFQHLSRKHHVIFAPCVPQNLHTFNTRHHCL